MSSLHIVYVLIILALSSYLIHCQHQQIHFDDFNGAPNWVTVGSVHWGSFAQCLQTTYCLRLSNIGTISKRHSLSTYGFWDIYIAFDINTWNYTTNDFCQLSYTANGGGSWQMLNKYGYADDGNDMEVYPGSDSYNNPNFQIEFENDVTSNHNKNCYIDSFRVMGIPITPSPTDSPTNFPTPSPTSIPSKNPTISPTPSPTTNPTMFPTYNPSLNPTNNPSLTPTYIPTNTPSISPSNNPTLEPTINHPTISPTTAIPTTPKPTILIDVDSPSMIIIKSTDNREDNKGSDTTLISTKLDINDKINDFSESNILGLNGSMMFIIIIILLIVLCIICGIFILLYLRKTNELKYIRKELNVLINNNNTVRLKTGNNSKENYVQKSGRSKSHHLHKNGNNKKQEKRDRERGKSYNNNIKLTNISIMNNNKNDNLPKFNRVISGTFTGDTISSKTSQYSPNLESNIEIQIMSASSNNNTPHNIENDNDSSSSFNRNNNIDYNDMYIDNKSVTTQTPMDANNNNNNNIHTNDGNTDQGVIETDDTDNDDDDQYNEYIEGNNNFNGKIRKNTSNDSDDDMWNKPNHDIIQNGDTLSPIDTAGYQSD